MDARGLTYQPTPMPDEPKLRHNETRGPRSLFALASLSVVVGAFTGGVGALFRVLLHSADGWAHQDHRSCAFVGFAGASFRRSWYCPDFITGGVDGLSFWAWSQRQRHPRRRVSAQDRAVRESSPHRHREIHWRPSCHRWRTRTRWRRANRSDEWFYRPAASFFGGMGLASKPCASPSSSCQLIR